MYDPTKCPYSSAFKNSMHNNGMSVIVKKIAMGYVIYIKDENGKTIIPPSPYDKTFPNENIANEMARKLKATMGIN